MNNKKKILWTILIALDVAITVFLFAVHIIMLANIVGKSSEDVAKLTGFIGYLAHHTTFYLWLFVIPLFVILAANIVGLVLFVKKQAKKETVTVSDLSDEQKEALKAELLKDLNKEN